jgi:hypothetical protein
VSHLSLSLGPSIMRLLLSSISFTTSVTPKMCWATYLIVCHRRCAACSRLSCLNDNAAGTMPRDGRCPTVIMPLTIWRIVDNLLTIIDQVALAIIHILCIEHQRQRNEHQLENGRVGDARVIPEAGSTPTSAVPGGRTKTNQVSLKRTRQIFRI